MYQRGSKNNIACFGLADISRTILSQDLPLSEHQPIVTEEVVSFRFLAGTLIWLDIISSITAGTAPYLLPLHSHVIAPKSQIKLEAIMGCRNWVMLQIGRISALYEQKFLAFQQGHFDCTEFGPIVGNISMEIQSGLTQGALESFHPSKLNSSMLDPHALITRMFTYMAIVYLHLVTRGFHDLEVLDTTVAEAVMMLQTQIPMNLLPVIVSPLYMIGSVARQVDQQFFRDVFSFSPLQDTFLKHRGRILPILEEIWRRRQTIWF
jgi:hypothetical protein